MCHTQTHTHTHTHTHSYTCCSEAFVRNVFVASDGEGSCYCLETPGYAHTNTAGERERKANTTEGFN